MTPARSLPAPPAIAIALLLGVSACKPSAPPDASTDITPPPSMDATQAGTGEDVSAAADALNPLTSPREAVIASMHKLMAARSFHTSVHVDGGPRGGLGNEVDFVAPDRFRIDMAGAGTQIVIGNTMHRSMNGRRMQVPMPEGTVDNWRDPGSFGEAEVGMTAQRQGSETVDGISTQKYAVHYTVPQASDATLWIGANGLPVQMRITSDNKGTPVTTAVRYSRINDPGIRIDAPN